MESSRFISFVHHERIYSPDLRVDYNHIVADFMCILTCTLCILMHHYFSFIPRWEYYSHQTQPKKLEIIDAFQYVIVVNRVSSVIQCENVTHTQIYSIGLIYAVMCNILSILGSDSYMVTNK